MGHLLSLLAQCIALMQEMVSAVHGANLSSAQHTLEGGPYGTWQELLLLAEREHLAKTTECFDSILARSVPDTLNFMIDETKPKLLHTFCLSSLHTFCM